MPKRVMVAGLLGCLVLMVWTLVVNGLLGFQARIDMKQIPAEREVYRVLKQHIVEPGRYVCNPELTPEERFPENEPVFSILYGGMGHGSAGNQMLLGLAVFLFAPLTGAWMLSQSSRKFLSSFPRKVLFFSAIGFLISLFSDLTSYGIGGYPAKDVVALALNHIVMWTLVGLVMAWRIKPEPSGTEGD